MKIDPIRYALLKQSAELKIEIDEIKEIKEHHYQIYDYLRNKYEKLKTDYEKIQDELRSTRYADSVVTKGNLEDEFEDDLDND